ncbi:N-acetylglucosamine/diacetylchitobiose ABC transporter substrate-binding protein [Microbacterium sp.]|uniref:N-acetylglucosamine/diacetylchitobiose ABC transporter substrate-binding protein n=1 Tax=Microbacterium sp. TaxID=51671 RepID=UPI003A89043F
MSALLCSRRHSLLTGIAAAMVIAVSACSAAAPSEPTAGHPVAGAFDAPADAPLEVFLFEGGYGATYADSFIDVYRSTLPGSRVAVHAVQEIATQLQPRFVAGDPPDVIDNSGAAIELTTLVGSGQLYDLGELLSAASLDDPGTKIQDTLTAGAVETGTFGDRFVALPYVNTVFGLWYSQALFDEKGWEVPRTWAEFLALGEKAADRGIALIAYPGQAIGYAGDMWVGLAGKEGGIDVLRDLDNLEPGAWSDPAVVAAFDALAELHERGMVLYGSEALTHTEAQTSFVLGEALFYPCGSWLENEMKKVTPEGFEMGVAPYPLLSPDAVLDASAVEVTPRELFIVPAEAKNPRGGLEFLRSMLSRRAAHDFSQLTGAPTVVKGALDDAHMPPGLASAIGLIDAATETDLQVHFRAWYPDLRTAWFEALADVLTGRADAQTVSEQLQRVADEVRADKDIVKYTRE